MSEFLLPDILVKKAREVLAKTGFINAEEEPSGV